jgi:hypothetical protein
MRGKVLSWSWLNSNLVGSLLGAIISGLVAIFAMKRQIKADVIKREQIKLEKFYKSSKIILIYAEKILKAGQSITRPMIESHQSRGLPKLKSIHEESIHFITTVYDDLVSYKKILEKIDGEDIYTEIYDIYLEMKLAIDDILYYTYRFLNHNASTVSMLEFSLEKLEEFLTTFKHFSDEKLKNKS